MKQLIIKKEFLYLPILYYEGVTVITKKKLYYYFLFKLYNKINLGY